MLWWCYFSICSNFFRTRGARGSSGLMRTLDVARLVRSLRSRYKTKNFPSIFRFSAGGGGSRQKIERKFLVLIRRYSLRKEQYLYFSTFGCSFFRLCGETRRFQFGCAVAHQILLCLPRPPSVRTNPRRF